VWIVGAPAAAADTKITVEISGGWKGLGATRTEAKSSCYNGRDLIDAGDRVKFTNEDGRTVGLGTLKWVTLGAATDNYLEDPEYYDVDSSIRFEYYCVMTATLNLKPAQFYDVTIGTEEGVSYTAAEIRRKKGKLSLTWG
jgi:hypothetical protein